MLNFIPMENIWDGKPQAVQTEETKWLPKQTTGERLLELNT